MTAAQHRILSVLLLVSIFIQASDACGGFFCEPRRPVIQTGESIVFGVEENRVTMHVQILYEGPAEAFSWLLPLPFQPTIDVGSDVLFQSLFDQSLPTFRLDVQTNDADDSSVESCLNIPIICANRGDIFDFPTSTSATIDNEDAIVLEEGSVGPFDFVIIQAADQNPESVLLWLEENGYDQPEGSAPLLNYYATNDHVFVALRLQKTAETGDIQPLILSYEMPVDDADVDTEEESLRMAMACVPIQLTKVAASDDMPIQIYILGQSRAVPLNFVDVELDDMQVDWVGCQNNPFCFDNDYRSRFNLAAQQLSNHSFVTEYAGPTEDVIVNLIAIPLTADEIAEVTSTDDFFFQFQSLFPTDATLWNTILQDYDNPEDFDAQALAEEFEEKVLKPSQDAQDFVDAYPYLTRLYARLSPESMTKDPFFAFKPELSDVSNIHVASAVPICIDEDSAAFSITVQLADDSTSDAVVVPVLDSCGTWIPVTPGNPLVEQSLSTARQLSSWGFAGDEGIKVLRSAEGSFDMVLIQEAISFGDSLVMNQTIPEYIALATTNLTLLNENTTLPVLPEGNLTTPVLPNENTTLPVLPESNSTTPVLPNENTTVPVSPESNSTTPVLPNENTTVPVSPEGNLTLPVLPNGNETIPVLPNENSTVPVLPSENTTVPVLANDNATVPVLPDSNSTTSDLPNDNATTPVPTENSNTPAPVTPESESQSVDDAATAAAPSLVVFKMYKYIVYGAIFFYGAVVF